MVPERWLKQLVIPTAVIMTLFWLAKCNGVIG